MPPRRRAAAAGASSSAATSTAKAAGTPRPSKLAKENGITAQEEAEIREAFSLFAEPMDGEKDGVMPIADVRRALIALGIPPTTPTQLTSLTSALDPEDEGFATYPAFVAVCAIQLHARRDAADQDDADEAHQAELDEAYTLFAGGDPDAPAITIEHLRKVAALLRLDQPREGDNAVGGGGGKGGGGGEVTEELLRDMILEANGGAGVNEGVRKEEFDGVMRRAGVWRG